MKKDYLMGLIACAALTITGCSNDEIGNPQQGQGDAIEFGTYLGRDAQGSRGTVTDINAIKGENKGFGILAFYTGQKTWTDWETNETSKPINFMYNQQVTSTDGTNWSYTPIKYWPTMKGDKLSFFAYAPYNANGITLPQKDATTATTSLTFTVADKVENMVDFVAAQAIDKTQKDAAAGGQEAVTFNFKHELSRLAFKVKSSMTLKDETHIVVKTANLVAAGFTKQATYTFNDEEGKTGTWSDPTGTFDACNLSGLITSKNVELGKFEDKKYKQQVLADITKGETVNLFGDGKNNSNYLFLIPVSNGIKDKTSAVTFTYDIVTEDANLEKGYSCTEATKTVYLPSGILEQGKAYNVTFTFNMDEIEVSASVDDWGDETSKDVDVPYTPDDATKANQGN